MDPKCEEDRRLAILIARRLLQQRPIFLDTETTGLGNQDEIVDIAVVGAEGEELLNSLVKPGRPIPADATAVHGIGDQDVAGAPRFDVVWDGQLRELLTGARLRFTQPVCIYNADFDARMIRQSLRQYGRDPNGLKPPYCLMELYAQFYGAWSEYHWSYTWQSLGNAAMQCHLPLPADMHRALADALLARQVLHYMAAQQVEDV